MMEDRSLRMQSTGPKKGSEVWYVFQRTEAWDDIGYTAIPRRLWGTYRAGDEATKGIRWMTLYARKRGEKKMDERLAG